MDLVWIDVGDGILGSITWTSSEMVHVKRITDADEEQWTSTHMPRIAESDTTYHTPGHGGSPAT